MAAKKYSHFYFPDEPRNSVAASTTTGLTVAAGNIATGYLFSGGRYLEAYQSTANTELGANTGFTCADNGWLLPHDNAAEAVEITQGILSGNMNFVAGTDGAFYTQAVFLITTRANHDHLFLGFRERGAYVATDTLANHLTAYDEKAAIGVATNGGVLRTHTSLATVDTSTNLAHAAAANGDFLALRVDVSAARAVTYKLGHATPAGTSYAQTRAAYLAAIADLAVDASAVAFTLTAADVFVPYVNIAGAGGAAISDARIIGWTTGLI